MRCSLPCHAPYVGGIAASAYGCGVRLSVLCPQAAAQHRVFKDLFNMSTFLVPRHELPPLPPHLRKQLAFALDSKQAEEGEAEEEK